MLNTPPHEDSATRLPVPSHSSNSQSLVSTPLSDQVDGGGVGDETLLATSLLDSSPGQTPVVNMSTPPGRPHQQRNLAAHSTDSETLVKVSAF